MNCARRKIFLVAILFFVSSPALAATHYVPDDFSTIQEALDGAAEGDTIIVRNGAYWGAGNKNLDFKGKALTLQSENGPWSCVIDCEGSGRGFFFHSGETKDAVVNGFTIFNGLASGTWPDAAGGGIFCSSSSPSIINCVVIGNVASDYAGAMYFEYSSASISDCIISGNSAVYDAGGILCKLSSPVISNSEISFNSAGHRGGGLHLQNDSSPIISGCVINNNSASYGGGIFTASSSPVISRCSINNNTGISGGGIYCDDSSAPSIDNCIMTANVAEHWGAAICSDYLSSPDIVNCTFDKNVAAWGGHALSCHNSTSPTLTNCVMWSEPAEAGPELRLGWNSSLDVKYCNVQGGESGVEVGIGSILTWGGGNIDADPLFVDTGDYHLSSDSPCVDAGTDAGIYEDIDGDGRPFGLGFDIGADEYLPVCTLDIIPNSTAIFRGGKLRYTAAAANLTDSPVTFQYWTTVKLPNGSIYPGSGVLFGPATVTLGAFESRPPTELTHAIPWTAPPGTYTYNAYIGTYPSAVINEDHFDFTVR